MAFWKGLGASKKSETLEFIGNGIDKPTNWKRGECIGTGAFGKVFKASIKTRQRGNIFLAVKEVGILLQQDKSKYEESVKKETEALKKLSHERIIKYFGFHATNESFFIFIELLEMGSLEKFINAKYDSGEHIDERHAGILTKQIIEGVVYLNENNLFHRDIKSANILMSDENNVKLADFGLTREFAEMTKTYTKGVGTNRFMAPEMIALKPDGSCYNYDKSVDIWAIGCIVIHMLTGKLPFSKLTDVQVVFKLGQPDPSPANEILSKVSESCRRFFKKTLARDPKARETAVLLLNDSFVKGEELPEFETDAGKEAPEGQIDEFDVRGDNWNLEQADVSNITESRIEEFDVRNDVKPYQSTTTNNDHGPKNQYHFRDFQGGVNFKRDQVNKIKHLHVGHIDSLTAQQVKEVKVDQVSAAVTVGQAEAISAQANQIRIEKADTVNNGPTDTISVREVNTIITDHTQQVNVNNAEFVVIDGLLNVHGHQNFKE